VGTSFSADGWGAGSIDAYREHWNGSGGDSDTTKTGSFYALKMYNASASGYVQQNLDLGKFRGRTITLGVWCKTSTSDAARTKINTEPSAGDVWSDYHTGGDGWEWIETTMTVGASETTLDIQLRTEVAATVYWSQPILSLGSAIGEGNYSRPSGEVIELERGIDSNLLNNTTGWSDSGADLTINLEADSNGKIPKGAAAVRVNGSVNDSGSAAQTAWGGAFMYLYGLDSNAVEYLECRGVTNDAIKDHQVTVKCDANGDIKHQINATGSATFDIPSLRYSAIKLR